MSDALSTTEARSRAKWRAISAVLLGAIFIFAGVSKLVFIFDFRGVIDSIVSQVVTDPKLPRGAMRQVMVVATPGIEIGVGAALIVCRHRPRVVAAIASAMLVAFSGVLVLLLTMDSPPACGCMGSWEVFRTGAKEGAVLGLVRNFGLLLLGVWLVSPGSSSSSIQREDRAGVRAGFTLIELLVVIVVVAALIGILLPALSHAKRAGKSAQTLSAVRQSLVAIREYTDAEQGFLPFLATPGQPELGVFPDGEWQYGPPSYFRGQATLWPTALIQHGIDLTELPRFSRPEEGPSRISTYIWMSHAAVARPEYWVGVDPPFEPSFFSGVRLDEAAFPSAKGLLAWVGWNEEESKHLTAWEVGMCDGSASLRSVIDPPMHVDDPQRKYGAVAWRVLTTPEGIRGRDY